MKRNNYWVVPHDGGWAVRREGGGVVAQMNTQTQAIEIGRAYARQEGSELIVQGRHGDIRSKDSYGHDPYPPKDKEH